jgi:hypothetical protein
MNDRIVIEGNWARGNTFKYRLDDGRHARSVENRQEVDGIRGTVGPGEHVVGDDTPLE